MTKLGSKRLIITGIPVLFSGLLAVEASAQSKPMVAEIMPPAKSGECYAKVSVPAKYRTEQVDVLIKEPTERFTITPAKFENRTKRVMTREASSTLKAVQPVLETEKDSFLVSPASTEWVRDSLKGNMPLSEGEKRDLSIAGVKIEEVPVGSCLYEHFREPTTKEIPNRVLVSEATEKLSTTPAKYRKGTESVLVKPAYKRLIEVPAVFRKKQDRVLVEAAHSVWQKGTGPIQKIDNETGEIMCRIDIPAEYEDITVDVVATAPLVTSVTEEAEYKTINIEKLVSDAAEQREPVAAEFKTMNKIQVAEPGGFTWTASRAGSAADGAPTGRVVCHKATPAETIAYERTVVKTAGRFERTKVEETFETVSVTELVSDARSVKTTVPGVNSTVDRRVKVEDSRFEWQAVLCETNTNGDIISRLQAALAEEGYSPGSIDGVLGQSTLTALEKYQQKNKLAEGGVTMESIKALGVEL